MSFNVELCSVVTQQHAERYSVQTDFIEMLVQTEKD